MKSLFHRLGFGRRSSPEFAVSKNCPPGLHSVLWSAYVLHRREGLSPLHVRKTKGQTVRVYRYQCYVVKEYTGDTSKLASEIDILQQLHHDSLVSYLFMVDEGARFSVVMDWAGCGLRTLVEQQQPLGEDVARYIAQQLTASLAYLHQKGIIHRDIKPDNIGVHPDLTMKLFDWGEALRQDQLQALTDKQLAKVAGVAGTVLFMPPEALLYLTKTDHSRSSNSRSEEAGGGSSSVEASGSSSGTIHPPPGCGCWGRQRGSSSHHQHSHHHCQPQQLQHPQPQQAGTLTLRGLTSPKLDIWGLGTVVFFLLAGRDILQDDSSYDLEDMAEVVNASKGIKLPPKSQASPAARDFLARALQRDPAQRASAEELLQHPWLAGLAEAHDQRRGALDQHKGALAMPPQLCLPQSRSSEGQASAYVIAAHHGVLSSSSGSAPETPVSSGAAALFEISE